MMNHNESMMNHNEPIMNHNEPIMNHNEPMITFLKIFNKCEKRVSRHDLT